MVRLVRYLKYPILKSHSPQVPKKRNASQICAASWALPCIKGLPSSSSSKTSSYKARLSKPHNPLLYSNSHLIPRRSCTLTHLVVVMKVVHHIHTIASVDNPTPLEESLRQISYNLITSMSTLLKPMLVVVLLGTGFVSLINLCYTPSSFLYFFL